MGFNFFKIVNLKDSFRKKLNGFVQSLGPAIRDGKTITFADNDISYLLKLQHDRIKDKDLTLDMEIYDRDKETNATVGSQWRDAHYESFVCSEQLGIKRLITRDGNKLYSDNRKSVLYATITDVTSGVHHGNCVWSYSSCYGAYQG